MPAQGEVEAESWRDVFDHSPIPIWIEDFSRVRGRFDELRADGVDDLAVHLAAEPAETRRLAGLVRVVHMSRATFPFFGVAGREALPYSLDAWFDAESLAVFARELDALWRGETSFAGEIRVRDPAGGRRLLDVKVSVMAGAEQTLRRVLVAFVDITARDETDARLRDSERRLRRSQAFLRGVLDATPSMIFVKDRDGRFVLANAALARIYGTTVDDMVGRTDADFSADPAEVEAFVRADREVIDGRREKLIAEEPVTAADGRLHWYDTVKVPLVEDDGRCDKVLGVATDVTARREAVEALRAADRQKDAFLATLAHELRNPLAAIASATHLVRAGLAQGQTPGRPLEVLERQIRNIARLLDDLLDVARITRGALQLRRERVALDAVVGGAVESQRALLEATGHQLTLDLPRDPVAIDGDATRLEQIVANLLNNAAKYTPAPGRIAVRGEHGGGWIAIHVSDNGMGIAPELLPRVFDIFAQGEQSLAHSRGGLGLGLSLVRRLVELHGGSIEARSDGPGRGSEFVVSLPEAAPAAAPPARIAPPARAARRILLVDDNLDLADLLSDELSRAGHDVTVAHDGPAALEAAGRVAPDIVLLDIGLPGIDGYEVARRLRHRFGAAPVLVALTGYGQEEDRRLSREAGFDHHLTKPVEPAVLEKLLAEARRPA
jgi:PAS domain S-box-containing protein